MAINEWSTTAGSNASGVTGINWAEGQAPSTVNDSARAMMADVAAWYGGAKAPEYLTGVAGTNTVTAGGPAAMAAYTTGQRVYLLPAVTNTGATTLNITPSGGAALGAKNIFWNAAALVGGELRASVPYTLEYDGTQFNILSAGSALQFKGAAPTANRIPYAVGSSALLQDSANLTFDGSTLTVTGAATVSGAITGGFGSAATVSLNGNTTGQPAYLQAAGSDSNVGLDYNTKGTGIHRFATNSAVQFEVINTTTAVNYITATGAAAAGNVKLASTGSDSFVNFEIDIKGAGDLVVPNVNSQTTGSAANVNVDASGNIRKSTSALRYKTDVRDMPVSYLDFLQKMRPVLYKAKDQGKDSGRDYIGFIADWAHDDGFSEIVAYDKDGKPDGFMYDRMGTVLVLGWKDHNARLKAIEGKLGL